MKLSHPELIRAISEEYDIDVETIRKVLNAIKDYMVKFLMDVEENEVNEIFPLVGLKVTSKIIDIYNGNNGTKNLLLYDGNKNRTLSIRSALTNAYKQKIIKEKRRLDPDF